MARMQEVDSIDMNGKSLPIDPALVQSDASKSARHGIPLGEQDDDLEWEYEYDPNETETFYLTLDLTSSLAPLRASKKRRVSEMEGDGEQDIPQVSSGLGSGAGSVAQGDGPSDGSDGVSSDSTTNRIQIMDLHGSNPIVAYQNQIYSCQWSQDVGTQLLFTAPASDSDRMALRKLRSTPQYDLLAATSLHLTSTAAQLMPRRQPRTKDQGISADSAQAGGVSPAEQVRIPVGQDASRARRDQGRFLERLMVAKESHGERDEVTVFARKRFTGTGWRSQTRLRKAVEWAELVKKAEEGDQEAAMRLAALDDTTEPNAGEQETATPGLTPAPGNALPDGGAGGVQGRRRGRPKGRRWLGGATGRWTETGQSGVGLLSGSAPPGQHAQSGVDALTEGIDDDLEHPPSAGHGLPAPAAQQASQGAGVNVESEGQTRASQS